MGELYVGEFAPVHFADHFAPEDARHHHIGFFRRSDAAPAQPRQLESDAGNAGDFRGGIDLGIDGALLPVGQGGSFLGLAEINAAGQLAHDQGLLAQAQVDLVRYQKLAEQNSIARQQYEDQIYIVQQYQGTVKLDQAQVDQQKLNVIYCRIVSPVTGRVGLRLVDPGNYVQTSNSTGLAVVTQMQPITVIATKIATWPCSNGPP